MVGESVVGTPTVGVLDGIKDEEGCWVGMGLTNKANPVLVASEADITIFHERHIISVN